MKFYPPSRYAVTGCFPDCIRSGISPHCTPAEMDENLHRYKELTGSLPAFAITWAPQFDAFRFPLELMEVMDTRGVTPDVILWPYGPEDLGGGCLDQINSGSLDDVLRASAREVYDWSYGGRRACMAQFGTEVTLGHYPWSATNNGGCPAGPAKYVAAHRRIHGIFAEAGCELTWLWHTLANFTGEPLNDPVQYYPGDEIADWVGFGLYRDHVGGLWETFQSGFAESMRQMAFVWGRKPGYVELMCQEQAGDTAFKADFLRECFDGLAGHVNAVGYWDAFTALVDPVRRSVPTPKFVRAPSNRMPVPAAMGIDSSTAALAAYRAGVGGPWYTDKARYA